MSFCGRARISLTRSSAKMPEKHRRFLISIKLGEPDWTLLDLPGVKDLPAVRWKLENLAKLNSEKRAQLLTGLNEALGMGSKDEDLKSQRK